MSPPNQDDMEKIVHIFKCNSRFPSAVAAKILSVAGSRLCVVSQWSQRNLERSKNINFQMVQYIDMTTGDVEDVTSFDCSSEYLTTYSLSYLMKALLRDVVPPKSIDQTPKKYLEVWKKSQLFVSLDLTSYDIHGEVYTDSEFSCLEWDPSESNLLYVAEKKKPKSEPFISNKSDSSKTEDASKGTEHEFVEEWGETLVGKSSPTFFVCNIETGKVNGLKGIPEDVCVGQGVWAPGGGVVGVAWSTQVRRLGLVYCTNRPSWIFYLTPQNEFIKLSSDGFAVRSPKFSPDGSLLVWIERSFGGPHHGCHRLMKCSWPDKKVSTVVDIIGGKKDLPNSTFYGFYILSLNNCWFKDNKTLLISTPQRASIKIFSVNTDTGEIKEVGEGGENESCSMSYLGTREDYVLATKSSLTTAPGLYITHFQPDSKPKWIPLVKETVVLPDFHVDVMRLKSNANDAVVDFSAIYLGPKNGTNTPLVVWPHGGPHSSFTNSSSLMAFLFAKVGFAVVMVNYRGSIGAGENSVNFLPGKVGRSDVDDVHKGCQTVLEKYSSILNPCKVVLWGGSHGGFLVLHLAGQFPLFYKAVSTRNPVVDIPSLFAITDVPDWAFVESGFEYSYSGLITPEIYTKMKESSPINYINDVKIPVLFLLGNKDLRVPYCNGLSFYHILKARKIKTRLLVYEDNHSLSQLPHEIDFMINTLLWFVEHANHQLK